MDESPFLVIQIMIPLWKLWKRWFLIQFANHDLLILLLRNALQDDSNHELHLKKGQKVICDPNLILDSSFHYTTVSSTQDCAALCAQRNGFYIKSTKRKFILRSRWNSGANSLPLLVEVVVDPPVGYGHHHDEDPEQHHAHHELVHHPHGHRRRLQVAARKEVRLYPLDSQYCD